MTHPQQNVINKIYEYLKETNGSLEHSIRGGICSGLTNFWLACLANDRIELFDNNINYIINYTADAADTTKPDPQMEEIIGALLIMQKNMHYLEDQVQNNMTMNLSIIKPDADFAVPKQEVCLINTYTQDEIEQLFASLPENALISISDSGHTIGITKKQNKLTIYDPNQKSDTTNLFEIFKTAQNGILTLQIIGYSLEKNDIIYSFPEPLISRPISNKTGALYLAITSGEGKLIKQLIQDGADINDIAGGNPAYTAICTYQHEALQALIEAGAELNVKTNDGSTLLHAGVLQAKLGYYDGRPINLGFVALCMLLEAGANPNFATYQGLTPVTFAIHKNELFKLALLLAYGATLESFNILMLTEKYQNKPDIWRLCQKISQFQKTLGKNSKPDLRLLKISNYSLNLDTSSNFALDSIEFLECISVLVKHGLKVRDINIIVDGQTRSGQDGLNILYQRIAEYIHNPNVDIATAWRLYELIKPWAKRGCGDLLTKQIIDLFARVQQEVLKINILNGRDTAKAMLNILDMIDHFTHLLPISITNIKLRYSAKTHMHNILAHLAKVLSLDSTKQVIDRLNTIQRQQTRLSFLSAPQVEFKQPHIRALIKNNCV